MKSSKRIILASASPRRSEILTSMGLDFTVHPADVDESTVKAKNPAQLTKRLSALKAGAIADDCTVANDIANDGVVVIGADTVVVFRGKVFGKPHTEDKAVEMLGRMCGHWHSVYTGVTVRCGDKNICFSVRSLVKMKALTDEEIISYVKETNPLDKAGAYGIQDGRVVQKYRGSYTNIVGLPKEKLAKALARLGV